MSDCITLTLTLGDGITYVEECECDVLYSISLGYVGSRDEEPTPPEVEIISILGDDGSDITATISDEQMREIKLEIVTDALHCANEQYMTERGQRALGNAVRRLQGLHDDIQTMIRREGARADF